MSPTFNRYLPAVLHFYTESHAYQDTFLTFETFLRGNCFPAVRHRVKSKSRDLSFGIIFKWEILIGLRLPRENLQRIAIRALQTQLPEGMKGSDLMWSGFKGHFVRCHLFWPAPVFIPSKKTTTKERCPKQRILDLEEFPKAESTSKLRCISQIMYAFTNTARSNY